LPEGHVHLLDMGHFALETHAAEIEAFIRTFLGEHLSMPAPGSAHVQH
jgi:hypothetical protein